MPNASRYYKILLTVLTLGFITWFGGSIIRTAIAYDLFTPTADMTLKTEYSDAVKMHTVYLYTSTSLYTSVGYMLSFLSIILIIFNQKKEMKKRGWLFMAIILFLIASPVEIYKIYGDIKLSMAIYYDHLNDFNSSIVNHYFIARFKNISIVTASSLASLASITSALYAVWRPLEKRSNGE